MDFVLVLGIILMISVLSCKTTGKLGLPVLVSFIVIGMLIGNWFKFDDMSTVDTLCNFALLLIIFTGGFQTDFSKARSVLPVSLALSTAGTVLTAGLAGVFAYFVLRLELYQALLLGAVISSTDAASVFSVLRSKNMNLTSNLDSVLEIESGSNDPFAYILTTVLITLAKGGSQNVLLLLLSQVVIGALAGFVSFKIGQLLFNKLNLDIDGVYGVLLCGTAFFTYGIAVQFGGNGFLAVYISGLILGNNKLVYKGFLSRLSSAISMLMQITLFIVLGILCIPSSVVAVMGSGLLFALFLFFVARPVVVFVLMKPFRHPIREVALVSWAGFRGAASIVFSTLLVTAGLPYAEYVFSVVFFVCLLSVIVQGTFISPIAKKLRLVDE